MEPDYMSAKPIIPAGKEPDAVIGELITSHWSDAALNLDVFGNCVSAGQYRIVYEAALSHLPDGAKVLDWGCGNGHFSYFLMRMGFRVTGFSFLDYPQYNVPVEVKKTSLGFKYQQSKYEPTQLSRAVVLCAFHDHKNLDPHVDVIELEALCQQGPRLLPS